MIEEDRSKRTASLERSCLRLRPLTRAEFRALDEYAAGVLGLPTLVLMENAGRGAAKVLTWAMNHLRSEDPCSDLPFVVIVCGPGNNGGDGAVLARHLDASGLARVKVYWIAPLDSLRGDAPTQFRVLNSARIDQTVVVDLDDLSRSINDADWVVDALFGTGLNRPLVDGEPVTEIVRLINDSGRPVISLDIPSGFDSDTGEVKGLVVKATITATFVAPKIGFYAPNAETWTGRVEIIDIGLPRSVFERYIKNH